MGAAPRPRPLAAPRRELSLHTGPRAAPSELPPQGRPATRGSTPQDGPCPPPEAAAPFSPCILAFVPSSRACAPAHLPVTPCPPPLALSQAPRPVGRWEPIISTPFPALPQAVRLLPASPACLPQHLPLAVLVSSQTSPSAPLLLFPSVAVLCSLPSGQALVSWLVSLCSQLSLPRFTSLVWQQSCLH